MKQITLQSAPHQSGAENVCLVRLVVLGLIFGFAMMLLWDFAGPSPLGHAAAWGIAVLAALKFWRAVEGA